MSLPYRNFAISTWNKDTHASWISIRGPSTKSSAWDHGVHSGQGGSQETLRHSDCLGTNVTHHVIRAGLGGCQGFPILSQWPHDSFKTKLAVSS